MTIFSKIIQGIIPCYKIIENDDFIAFLDINPLTTAHTLVVPKLEIDQFFQLPHYLLQNILLFAQPIAKAIEKVTNCNRCGISVVGLEIPHAHLHLIPINHVTDANITKPKVVVTAKELLATQQLIINAL